MNALFRLPGFSQAAAAPCATRRTALDPPALLAEVNLLLDYVSGRPDIGLDSGSAAKLQGTTYPEALNRFFKLRDEPVIVGDDLRFLLSLRDYLNSAAYPASGRTVAFSTMVTREATGSPRGSGMPSAIGDALCAYPEFERLAVELRLFMKRLQFQSIFAIVIVALLAAYVFAGNQIVTRIASLSTQFSALDNAIEKEEMAEKPTSGQYKRLCQAIMDDSRKIQVFPNPHAMHVCDQQSDTITKISNAYKDLNVWLPMESFTVASKPEGGAPADPAGEKLEYKPVLVVTDQNASVLLAVLNGYLIPVLMSFIGSAAYVLRLYLRNLGDRLLTPRDQRSNTGRIVLGVLSGVAIGFFLSPTPAAGQGAAGAGMVVNVTAPALGFIAGYAVDVVFKFLDNLSDTVFLKK